MGKKYHLDQHPIPEGFRIFEERLNVMGITQRKNDALAFARGNHQFLTFEPEPENAVDRNAIKIVGHWSGWWIKHSRMLGYVPKEVASRISAADVSAVVAARLLKTYAGPGDFVEVQFQIVGPTEYFARYAEMSPSYAVKAKAKVAAGDIDEAEAVLLVAVRSTERESEANGYGVVPRPYLELAKIYRKAKRRVDEIEILERYERQKKAPGRLPEELAMRLAKLRETDK